MRQLLFKIFKYDKFMQKTASEQRSFLFWWIQIISIIVFIMLLFFPWPVFADSSDFQNYYQYDTDDSCINIVQTRFGYENFNFDADVRIVVFTDYSSGRLYRYYAVYNGTFKYWFSGDNGFISSCSSPFYNASSVSNAPGYYATGPYYILSGSELNSFFNVVDLGRDATVDDAVEYTYGESALRRGYLSVADNYCFDFAGNTPSGSSNAVRRSIKWNVATRAVYLYSTTANSYRIYFFYPWESSVYYYQTDGSTCSASASTGPGARTFDGVQYGAFYSTFNNEPDFPYYTVTDFSYDLAYQYTYSSNAVFLGNIPDLIDYSNVEVIYPPQNNYDVASFATAVNGNYDQIPDSTYLALYFTRYDKALDSLYSYRLILEDEVNYPISYTLGTDSLTLGFNNNIFTSTLGITSIYDHSTWDFYSPTNRLSERANYLNNSYWNTYNIAYTDISNADVIQHAITTIFTNTNSQHAYYEYNIPSSITFDVITTNYDSLVSGQKIKFFTSTVETDEFYDYYVILAFRSKAFSGVLSDFYNMGNTYTLEDGIKVLNPSYYSIIPYLNQKMMFENYKNDNDVQQIDDYVNETVDTDVIPQFDSGYVENNINFTEEEYLTVPAVDAFENLFKSLTELVQSSTVDNQTLLNLIQSNTNYFFNCLTSFDNPNLTTTSNFIADQLDWVYGNTVLNIPINIAMVSAIIWAVIF